MQPQISLPIAQADLAHSLVAWLNRPRVPAPFKEEWMGRPTWSGPAVRRHLREYAESWIEAAYQLKDWKWQTNMRESVGYATIALCQAKNQPVGTTIKFTKPVITRPGELAEETSVEAKWEGYEQPDDEEPTEEEEAADDDWMDKVEAEMDEQKATVIFLSFITGPYFDKIARCSRCGRYFLNVSGHRNKQFCSSRCAHIASAMQSKERKHQQKVDLLQRAARKLPRTIDDPKEWLAKKAGVSRHFVTRAINQGLIQLNQEA